MKQRFGAILCMLLGGVMIAGGLGGTSDATAGSVAPTCGQILQIGTPAATCPTGTITFSETTVGTTSHGPWSVKITSSCLDPNTNSAVDMTVTVPDGGSKASGLLYIYPDQSGATTCSYAYTEAPAPLYDTTYAPTSPQSITFQAEGPSNLDVSITNTFVPPTSVTRAPSSPASSSRAATSEARTTAPASSAGASAIQLSNTGPRSQVGATLWVGVAVFLFGAVLLFVGRRPQGARARK